MKIQSPLRYAGGKHYAKKFISNFIPPFVEFREPMCGAAHITFHLANENHFAKFIINDIDYNLYCFWKTIKENPEKLWDKIDEFRKQASDYKQLITSCRQMLVMNNILPLERAACYYICNKISYGAVITGSGGSPKNYQRFMKWNKKEYFVEVSKLLQNIEIYHGDYARILSKPGKDVVIYLDPPYYSNKSSYLYGFKGNIHVNFDHERLFRLVKNCSHKVLISYDNCEYIKNLYKDFDIIEYDMVYSITAKARLRSTSKPELLIANFSLGNKKEYDYFTDIYPKSSASYRSSDKTLQTF